MRRSLFLLMTLLVLPAAAEAAQDRMQPNLKAGIQALQREDYRDAVKQLESAIVADPRNPDGYNQLGQAYQGLGDYRKALKYYAITLELDPNHRAALQHQGEAQLRIGDIAAAEETLQTLRGKCEGGCEQYQRLRRAIGNHKAGQVGQAE